MEGLRVTTARSTQTKRFGIRKAGGAPEGGGMGSRPVGAPRVPRPRRGWGRPEAPQGTPACPPGDLLVVLMGALCLDSARATVDVGGMYSVKNLLTQDPEAVKGAILAVLAALVLSGVIEASGEVIAAWAFVIERVLGMLYVRPLVANKAALAEWGEAVDAEVAARTRRPLRAAPDE